MPVTDNFRFPNIKEAARYIAADLTNCLGDALLSRGRASLAVSGGRTPEYIFPLLARADLVWANIIITLADDRWVPSDHADSNERLTRHLLLTGPAATAHFVGLKTDDEDSGAGSMEAEKRLAEVPWPLDAVFLGMGPDGHIASLFPGGDWGQAAGRVIGVAATEERQARMSLTPTALLDSRRIFLIFSGADKQAAYDEALKPGPVSELPVRLILHQDSVPVTVYAAS